jgi:hypothetical protein
VGRNVQRAEQVIAGLRVAQRGGEILADIANARLLLRRQLSGQVRAGSPQVFSREAEA